MAILISGILIALVIAFKDNTPKYTFVDSGDFGYYKMNTQTGYVCYGSIVRDSMRHATSLNICDEYKK